VDGGYFEGSGVLTAEKLALVLDSVVRSNKASIALLRELDIVFNIIVITASYDPTFNFFHGPPRSESSGDIVMPLNTLLLAWRARNAAFTRDVGELKGGRVVFSSARFENKWVGVPVGWLLGKFSREYIDAYSGRPQYCGAGPSTSEQRVNDCLVKKIIDDLSPF